MVFYSISFYIFDSCLLQVNHLTTHLDVLFTILSKGYSFNLTRQLFNVLPLQSKTISRRVNTLFISLSICKRLEFLLIILLRDLHNRGYVTNNGVPLMLLLLWLVFFILKLANLPFSFQNWSDLLGIHFSWTMISFPFHSFSKSLSELHILLIRDQILFRVAWVSRKVM